MEYVRLESCNLFYFYSMLRSAILVFIAFCLTFNAGFAAVEGVLDSYEPQETHSLYEAVSEQLLHLVVEECNTEHESSSEAQDEHHHPHQCFTTLLLSDHQIQEDSIPNSAPLFFKSSFQSTSLPSIERPPKQFL